MLVSSGHPPCAWLLHLYPHAGRGGEGELGKGEWLQCPLPEPCHMDCFVCVRGSKIGFVWVVEILFPPLSLPRPPPPPHQNRVKWTALCVYMEARWMLAFVQEPDLSQSLRLYSHPCPCLFLPPPPPPPHTHT